MKIVNEPLTTHGKIIQSGLSDLLLVQNQDGDTKIQNIWMDIQGNTQI